MDFQNLERRFQLMLPTAPILLLFLIFAPWHQFGEGSWGLSQSAIQAPNALLGVIALLAVVISMLISFAQALGSDKLPESPQGKSWEEVLFLVGAVMMGALLLKLILETSFLGWGAWTCIIAAAINFYGAYVGRQSGSTSQNP